MSRIHIASFPADAGRIYEVTLGGKHRGRPVAWFRRPALLQPVLRVLRYMDKKGQPLGRMAETLAAGAAWARGKA